jgi:hypothetical protein
VGVLEFQDAVRRELQTGNFVIAASRCLDEILPEREFGSRFKIYVMKLTTDNRGS